MRRCCIFLCVVMSLIMVGCNKNYITPDTDKISFTAHISYYNEQYTADVINTDGVFTMVIKEPEILKDVKFIFEGNSARAEFNGIEYIPDKNNTQFFGVADKIYAVFSDIKGKKAVQSDGNYEIEGKVLGSDYEITFASSGLPLDLELEDNIYVRFSNVKLLS